MGANIGDATTHVLTAVIQRSVSTPFYRHLQRRTGVLAHVLCNRYHYDYVPPTGRLSTLPVRLPYSQALAWTTGAKRETFILIWMGSLTLDLRSYIFKYLGARTYP